jgi:thioredoxin 1
MDADPLRDAGSWWVVCLCAGWCGVCRDWRDAFVRASRASPQKRFAWVDVEDDADAMGDFEIETFPTLLVARSEKVMFLGPIEPTESALLRLLAAFDAVPQPYPGLPPDATALFERLKPQVLPRAAV